MDNVIDQFTTNGACSLFLHKEDNNVDITVNKQPETRGITEYEEI